MRIFLKALLALSLVMTGVVAPALAGVPKVVFIDEYGFAT